MKDYDDNGALRSWDPADVGLTRDEVNEAVIALGISAQALGGTLQSGWNSRMPGIVTVTFDSMLHAAQWVAAWDLQGVADTLASSFDKPLGVAFPLKVFYRQYTEK